MKLNATQKNLLFAAGTAAVSAAGPVGPVAVLGLLAQPALAATRWTKDQTTLAKVGQASLGAALSFVAIGVGGMMNPTFEYKPQVAETPAPVEQVVETPVAEAPTEEVVETPVAEPEVEEPVAEVPAPAEPEVEEPVAEVPAPAPAPSYEYPTRQAALNEMCQAGKQYFGDVLKGWMTVEQGKNEVRQYSTYLSRNSPASKSDLLAAGMGCSKLWSF